METKAKVQRKIKEVRACLRGLASGGIVGVENCHYIAMMWMNLNLIEEYVKKIPEDERDNNKTREDQTEEE